MAISVVKDESRRRVIATASGALAINELVNFVRTQRTGDLQTYALLFDARGADIHELSAESARQLAHEVGALRKRSGPRAPVAIIADTDALFGTMRMYQMMADTAGVSDIHVVRSLEEAEAALGW